MERIIPTIEEKCSVVVTHVPSPAAVKVVRLSLNVPHAEVVVYLDADQAAALREALGVA